MASLKEHKKLTKLILGDDYEKVHKFMDFPQKFLGTKHRKLFHDTKTAFLLALLNPNWGYAALLHVWLDNVKS